jgi:phage anti-repressor protein
MVTDITRNEKGKSEGNLFLKNENQSNVEGVNFH